MKQQQIKFLIKPDGTVDEEVIGVTCNECTAITKHVEANLGTLTKVTYKPDYYAPCEIRTVTQHESESLVDSAIDHSWYIKTQHFFIL